MLSYPSGMTVSSRALGVLSDALRAQRNQRRSRWRKLPAGRQALLVVAYLRAAWDQPLHQAVHDKYAGTVVIDERADWEEE